MGVDANGRAAARSTYESIIRYIGKVKDKDAEFSSYGMGRAGEVGYYKNGFHRLINSGLIKVVGRERGKRNNLYKMGEGILAMSLDEVLSLSYDEAMRRFNNK